ncbi:MAG TPA: hypothetical protein PLR99_05255 [Polyangiaceae bacterium]|nr:hypothetical protein [Polyangiaceae bacterium]
MRHPGDDHDDLAGEQAPGEHWARATFFEELRNPAGLRVGLHLADFVANVSSHAGAKHELPLVSFATFTGDRRALANVETVTALAFDLDVPQPSMGALVSHLLSAPDVDGLAAYVHTTFTSAPGALKSRTIIPISRPMNPDEHGLVWRVLADALARGGIAVDGACKDPSRAFFVPSRPPSGVYEHASIAGDALDVDAWIDVGRVMREADEAERAAEARRLAMRAPRRLPVAPGKADTFERARRYLATMPSAIAGQRGHDATFRAALVVVVGFGLEDADALRVLAEWNQGCSPPWGERDLARKITQAREHGRLPEGFLLAAERRANP